MIVVTEADAEQDKIKNQRNQTENDPDADDQNQEGCQKSRPGDQGHAKRNNAEILAAVAIFRAEIEQFSHSQAQQNQSAGNLKIGDGNAKRTEDDFAQKNKPDRDGKRCNQSQFALPLPPQSFRSRAQSNKNRYQPDRIDRDK